MASRICFSILNNKITGIAPPAARMLLAAGGGYAWMGFIENSKGLCMFSVLINSHLKLLYLSRK
jgi:hypothetical protein